MINNFDFKLGWIDGRPSLRADPKIGNPGEGIDLGHDFISTGSELADGYNQVLIMEIAERLNNWSKFKNYIKEL